MRGGRQMDVNSMEKVSVAIFGVNLFETKTESLNRAQVPLILISAVLLLCSRVKDLTK